MAKPTTAAVPESLIDSAKRRLRGAAHRYHGASKLDLSPSADRAKASMAEELYQAARALAAAELLAAAGGGR